MLQSELLEEKYIGSFETLYVYSIRKRKELIQLKKLGVEPVFFRKGKRGFIFTGSYEGKKVGIKIKNTHAETDSIYNEVNMLKKVNELCVGPKLLWSNEDIVVYEFFEGVSIGDWIVDKNKDKVIDVLREVFDELRILDINKLDKKEMSHPHKHVLVSDKGNICLIDYERCRLSDNLSNVTGFCQFVTSSHFGESLKKKGIIIDKEEIIKLSKEYKKDYSDEAYHKLIKLIKNS